MKIEKLQKFIQNSSSELYSFAYILIPDDLQASQLMIDSLQSFLIQKKILIDKIISPNNREAQDLFAEVKLHLFKIIFELSKKRYQQLKLSFREVERSGIFFSLDFDEKAVLYLKDKGELDLGAIEFIISGNRAVILSHLYASRIKLAGLMPNSLLKENIGEQGFPR